MCRPWTGVTTDDGGVWWRQRRWWCTWCCCWWWWWMEKKIMMEMVELFFSSKALLSENLRYSYAIPKITNLVWKHWASLGCMCVCLCTCVCGCVYVCAYMFVGACTCVCACVFLLRLKHSQLMLNHSSCKEWPAQSRDIHHLSRNHFKCSVPHCNTCILLELDTQKKQWITKLLGLSHWLWEKQDRYSLSILILSK